MKTAEIINKFPFDLVATLESSLEIYQLFMLRIMRELEKCSRVNCFNYDEQFSYQEYNQFHIDYEKL